MPRFKISPGYLRSVLPYSCTPAEYNETGFKQSTLVISKCFWGTNYFFFIFKQKLPFKWSVSIGKEFQWNPCEFLIKCLFLQIRGRAFENAEHLNSLHRLRVLLLLLPSAVNGQYGLLIKFTSHLSIIFNWTTVSHELHNMSCCLSCVWKLPRGVIKFHDVHL